MAILVRIHNFMIEREKTKKTATVLDNNYIQKGQEILKIFHQLKKLRQ